MQRFYDPHRRDFDEALAEIRRSRKVSHWMWYIFPQLKGLGRSSTAQFYGLDGLEEAQRFAADPVLGGNLRTITKALLDQPVRHAWIIFGRTDAIKLRSCMTLFAMADPDCGLYARVLEEFFRGEGDPQTLKMLK